MTGANDGGSRRYLFPPLWLMPIIVILGIVLVWTVSTAFGVLGIVVGIVVIAWLERRADAYVRRHDSSEDD